MKYYTDNELSLLSWLEEQKTKHTDNVILYQNSIKSLHNTPNRCEFTSDAYIEFEQRRKDNLNMFEKNLQKFMFRLKWIEGQISVIKSTL
jgi:hypothetical protein